MIATKEQSQTLDELEASFPMPPETIDPVPTAIDEEAFQIEAFAITTADIVALKTKYAALTCDTPADERQSRTSERFLRRIQINIDKRRLKINADSQAKIKNINGAAKKLTAFVETIKAPITLMLTALDNEREAAAKAIEDAELLRVETERQATLEAERAQRQAAYEAEQAKLKAEADRLAAERAELAAERKRMDDLLAVERSKAAEQQRVEQERLAKFRGEELARIDAERERVAVAQRAAQERIDAANAELARQQKIVDDARIAAERAEFERLATIKAEADARAKAEQQRVADEQAAKDKAAADEAERERLAAMAPDKEKLKILATIIRGTPLPEVESDAARAALAVAVRRLATTAADLEAFSA